MSGGQKLTNPKPYLAKRHSRLITKKNAPEDSNCDGFYWLTIHNRRV